MQPAEMGCSSTLPSMAAATPGRAWQEALPRQLASITTMRQLQTEAHQLSEATSSPTCHTASSVRSSATVASRE
ncbi:hypothetical protein E2C01_089020 [Portunus trituberculatus]|uniref:Uncharacterized protein n=1 Tax=Portunus trituberculatus TaxID=210409 RepID=A0A5B7JH05_PORTR|nr:hypothetical protein [Portunus trituberculatus]